MNRKFSCKDINEVLKEKEINELKHKCEVLELKNQVLEMKMMLVGNTTNVNNDHCVTNITNDNSTK